MKIKKNFFRSFKKFQVYSSLNQSAFKIHKRYDYYNYIFLTRTAMSMELATCKSFSGLRGGGGVLVNRQKILSNVV